MINKETVIKNFSKYARYYDKFSVVQNLCASKLIERAMPLFKENNRKGLTPSILDIGCGTGNYTKLLMEKFPGSAITAVDISREMVEIAKEKLKGGRIKFITEDAEGIDFRKRFDLISSNASFQWFDDLGKTLLRYKGLLNQKGVILFSTFGPLTFCELESSLKELCGRHTTVTSGNFFNKAAIEKFLRPIFKNVKIEEKIYKENYRSLPELLRNIKYTGVRGNGVDTKSFWTRKMMRALEKIYKKKYGNITATYEAFFCRGVS